MAPDTITKLTISTLMVVLVVFGLVSTFVLLANNEGRGEIFDDYPEIEEYNLNLTTVFTDGTIIDVANVNSNISADYNPEIAISAADQSGNAIATNLQDILTIGWTSLNLLGFILFGNIWVSILSTLVISIIGYITTAYIIKSIRTGQT